MTTIARKKITISGQVQGVGFRPFIYRLALEKDLAGTVQNGSQGVVIHIQGDAESVENFPGDIRDNLPALAQIVEMDVQDENPEHGLDKFEIVFSSKGTGHNVLISPDTATCADCLNDLFDPDNPRYLYPFTNCTNCGPRYTITRSIPYDRPYTSMACFPLCPDCEAEYNNPLDRRFHAQPNACPKCGPHVWLTDVRGETLAEKGEAMEQLAGLLDKGKIIAVKGLGGFHLVCDAMNSESVRILRQRKTRPDKPLAVMVADMDAARALAHIGPKEEQWLTGGTRPIVLCLAKPNSGLSPLISPDTQYLGLMLPYTPLHHVLLKLFKGEEPSEKKTLVMTSGNAHSEPISLGNREALKRLEHIADGFLFHNRDILIRTDDSVLRVEPETESTTIFRRARGFAPSPVFLPKAGETVLGLGPELKCTLCLTKGDQAFLSQHIGNMTNLEVFGFYKEILDHLQDVLQVSPKLAVRDLHPDYMTTDMAHELEAQDLPVKALQHHFAHIYACLAENKHLGPALGLALDGTGFGEDGTIWGGEFLFADSSTLEQKRMARFSRLLLPGGDMAVRQPWRIAQGLLMRLDIDPFSGVNWPWLDQFGPAAKFLPQAVEKNINCPKTSSCGRLYDAISALLGVSTAISYEGQAAIRLEATQDFNETGAYPCPVREDEVMVLDTLELAAQVVEDIKKGVPVPVISRRFHLGLARGIAHMAEICAQEAGTHNIALSGGAAQNMTMSREIVSVLEAKGFTVLTHAMAPANDGGVSLGQAFWGQRLLDLGKI